MPHPADRPATGVMTGEILPRRRRSAWVRPAAGRSWPPSGGGGYEGYRCFVEGRFLVSTDDAYVKADMSTIAAKVGGYVTAVPVVDNAVVVKGEVLATHRRRRLSQRRRRRPGADRHAGRHGRADRPAGRGQAPPPSTRPRPCCSSAKADGRAHAAEFERADSLMQSQLRHAAAARPGARRPRPGHRGRGQRQGGRHLGARPPSTSCRRRRSRPRRSAPSSHTTLARAERDLRFTVDPRALRRRRRQQGGPAGPICAARHAAAGAGAARQRLCRGQLQGDPGRRG